MGGQDRVEIELEQRLERRVEALPVEAFDRGVDLLARPHNQATAGLGHRVAEDEGLVAR